MDEENQSRMTIKQGLIYMKRGLCIIKKLFPWYLSLSTLSAILEAVRPLITLYLSARILDELSGPRNLNTVFVYTGLAVGLNFILIALSAFISRKSRVISSASWYRQQQFKGERYADLDYEYVEQNRINEMLSEMTARENSNGLGLGRLFWNYTTVIQQLCGVITSVVLLTGIFHFTAQHTAYTFATSIWAVLLLAVLIVLMLIIRVYLLKRSGSKMQTIFKTLPKSNTLMTYYMNYYIKAGKAGKDIRIYHQQDAISAILKNSGWAWLILITKISCWTDGIGAAVNAVISGCVYLLIGLRGLAGMYGIGQVTQYIGAVTAMSENLSNLISTIAVLWENAAFLPSLYEYLDLPDIKYKGSLTTEKRADNEYKIEYHNVSFKYPGSESYALKNLNLKLHVGERLAVVGMNGSGKTTMIKLLCRLYDPTEGMITLNGIDIRKYDYNEYMGIFSVVFQDFKLLSFPLGQNAAASVDYDERRVLDSLQKVGFTERMEVLKDGLDTALYKEYDENGVEISGGEAQKIALARAIYKDAPFIVLDEPTAALDPIAEYDIYSKFNEIIGSKTAIYISHRLSSCRFCDDIAVFHEGRLIQRGSHDKLIQDMSGKYYELWNAQAQYYTEKSAG